MSQPISARGSSAAVTVAHEPIESSEGANTSRSIVPEGEDATILPNGRRPYALPGDFEADGGYALRDGEVYRSIPQQAYFYVRQTGAGYERRWLSSPYWPGEVSTVEQLPDQSRAYYEEYEPVEFVASGFPNVKSAWYLTGTVESPISEDAVPDTTRPLSVERVRSRIETNRFLSHPLVGHQRGSVVGWKACFGLRYAGDLVAVAVLSRPSARHADDGETIELSRFASHPLRPLNTGTRLLAEAKQWAALEGYTDLISYAGVAGNEGTLYHASGLDAELQTTAANGSGWGNRSERDSWSDYERRKFSESLREPEATPSESEDTTPGQRGLDAFGVGDTDDPLPIKQLTATHVETGTLPSEFFGASESGSRSEDGAMIARSPTTGDVVAGCRLADGATIDAAPNAAACVTTYSHESEDLTAPTNTGAWLLGKAREWATLEGYEQIVAMPRTDTHEAARKRCGIETVN